MHLHIYSYIRTLTPLTSAPSFRSHLRSGGAASFFRLQSVCYPEGNSLWCSRMEYTPLCFYWETISRSSVEECVFVRKCVYVYLPVCLFWSTCVSLSVCVQWDAGPKYPNISYDRPYRLRDVVCNMTREGKHALRTVDTPCYHVLCHVPAG